MLLLAGNVLWHMRFLVAGCIVLSMQRVCISINVITSVRIVVVVDCVHKHDRSRKRKHKRSRG